MRKLTEHQKSPFFLLPDLWWYGPKCFTNMDRSHEPKSNFTPLDCSYGVFFSKRWEKYQIQVGSHCPLMTGTPGSVYAPQAHSMVFSPHPEAQAKPTFLMEYLILLTPAAVKTIITQHSTCWQHIDELNKWFRIYRNIPEYLKSMHDFLTVQLKWWIQLAMF